MCLRDKTAVTLVVRVIDVSYTMHNHVLTVHTRDCMLFAESFALFITRDMNVQYRLWQIIILITGTISVSDNEMMLSSQTQQKEMKSDFQLYAAVSTCVYRIVIVFAIIMKIIVA